MDPRTRPSTPGDPARSFAGSVVRHRRSVIAAWLLAAALLAPASIGIGRVLDVSARVPGSESAAVDEMLGSRFDSPFAHYAVLVITGVPAPSTTAGRSALEATVAALRHVRGVTKTASYLDAADASFLPDRGDGTFVLVGIDAGGARPDAMVPPLRAATERIAPSIRREHPAATFRWTGQTVLNFDIRRTSATEAKRAEMRALPLTLLMLVVAFGAFAAAALPALSGALAVVVTLGVTALLARFFPLSILLENVVTMLGLGLGVDYALLIVSRFREELAAGFDAATAAERAGRIAGHTVIVSGAAVLIGFVALTLVPLTELRSVAVGGALVVIASVLLAVTLLPAMLAMLGSRIDAGRIGRARTGARGSERWRRWGRWVADRPVRVLVVASIPVLLLASTVRHMDTSLPRAGWLPPPMESAVALDALLRMGRSGTVQSLRVIVELPEGANALGTGWAAVARLSAALASDARVARVQSLPTIAGASTPDPLLIAAMPRDLVRTFVSRDRRLAILEVAPQPTVDFRQLTAFTRELRRQDAGALSGLRGARLLIGGMPAFNADYEDAIATRLPLVVLLVVAGTFIALAAGFRSVLVAAKAIALNLLSVAAALGAAVLVFQDGHGVRLLGVPHAMGGLFPSLPALVFCIVFGLSLDYEVFLVARVAEARRSGLDDREALAEGLARTGGVITSAASIMVAVFAAFTLGDFLMVKILGFALATAVLLDATIVRVAIGPALLRLAGRWNWWPGERASPARASDASAGD